MLILPILIRGYTSVIVLNPEKWHYKESWATDMSPTALFTQRGMTRSVAGTGPWCSGGVPGVGMTGGWLGGSGGVLPGYPGPASQDPYLVYLKAEALPTAK